jgi:hypothetical protein
MDFTDLPEGVRKKLKKFIEGKGTHDLDQAWENVKKELLAYIVAHSAVQTLVKDDNIFWQTIEKALAIVMLETIKRQQETGGLE